MTNDSQRISEIDYQRMLERRKTPKQLKIRGGEFWFFVGFWILMPFIAVSISKIISLF